MSGAVEYLFNCLSHPGTCTKEDVPEIRRAAEACNGNYACIDGLRQFAAEAGLPVPRVSMWQALKELMGIGIGGGAMGAVAMAGSAEALTVHGAERLAGAAATRGGVLSAEQAALVQQNGVMYLQPGGQGAAVYVLENAAGRFDVAIYGARGLITTIANMRPASLGKLAERYGWK